MSVITILLGGNLGNRVEIMKKTINLLNEKLGDLINESAYYETEAWGFESDNLFLNKVVVYDTSLNPKEALLVCQDVEKQLGRLRHKERYTSRNIDVDILFFDDLILDTPDLIIPHPRIQLRRFVLKPLLEIDPDYVHPVLNKNIRTLLNECTDISMVEKIIS
ncbi:MAG: 2-amino-4-hydroxy-6-hydroxymethyldihydropteridine diphosphokinase [Marinifilaceae bacterium]|jgi:2-amino-4-hydroxy-6-hydroxymethyldihydropteridine diphosphokinase|nr:2-amino-4-hydroxy-6-hydroxymethyldihydropteridine diphosphokinase [Marinifilaceae bacterium]